MPDDGVLEPELEICDPHHHLMANERLRYERDDLLADLGCGHQVVKTVYLECMEHYRSDGPEALRPVGEVEHVVAQDVPPGVMDGIVAHADLRLGDAVAEVLEAERVASQGRLCGIRYNTVWDADPAIISTHSEPHVLLEPQVRRAAAAVGAAGLVLDCWMYSPQLDDMVELAQSLPDQVFVLDHLGGPLIWGPYADGREEVLSHWRDRMQAIAACPNVSLKIGGLGMERLGAPWSMGGPGPSSEEVVEHWAPEVEFCIETFGPDRSMFESNFPVDRMLVDYLTLWNAFKILSRGYSASERRALLHDTAVRTYGL